MWAKVHSTDVTDDVVCPHRHNSSQTVLAVQEQGDAEHDAAHRHTTWRRLMSAIQQRWAQLLSTLQVLISFVMSLHVYSSCGCTAVSGRMFQVTLSHRNASVQNASCDSLCASFSYLLTWQLMDNLTRNCVQVWTSSAYALLPSSASVYASTASLFGSKSPLRRFDRVHWSLMSGLVVVSAVYLVREHGLSTRERRLRKELINSQAEISKLVMKVMHQQMFTLHPQLAP